MLSTVVVLLLKSCKGIINLDREECIIVKKTFCSSPMIAVRKLCLLGIYVHIWYGLQHNVTSAKYLIIFPFRLLGLHVLVVSCSPHGGGSRSTKRLGTIICMFTIWILYVVLQPISYMYIDSKFRWIHSGNQKKGDAVYSCSTIA
jgi:hypothetical protein